MGELRVERDRKQMQSKTGCQTEHDKKQEQDHVFM